MVGGRGNVGIISQHVSPYSSGAHYQREHRIMDVPDTKPQILKIYTKLSLHYHRMVRGGL